MQIPEVAISLNTLICFAHLAGARSVSDAKHTEANELRHSRLVEDLTSSRKPSLIYLRGLETAGQGLPRPLGFFVFGHHTDENGQFTHQFLTLYHKMLCHSHRVLFIYKFQGPPLDLAGRPPPGLLIVDLMNGWPKEGT